MRFLCAFHYYNREELSIYVISGPIPKRHIALLMKMGILVVNHTATCIVSLSTGLLAESIQRLSSVIDIVSS